MMSKKKWCGVLCLFIVYLLFGAGIFYNIESHEEFLRLEQEKKERKKVEEMLLNYIPHYIEDSFFEDLSNYCEKPLGRNMSKYVDTPLWDFYHSLFFVITVVSTIGYGNLAPTTMFSRIFMIFYALIGIPMNGIVMVTLGAFFGHSFEKLYQRWKASQKNEDITRLGLISQIILYLVPGFTFFIFLPAVIIVIFEAWPYDVAVYYAFVSLTTIGFGDYVAGKEKPDGISEIYYKTYQIFLLVWMIGGLGYVLMILGFITKAMNSKQIRELEHMITHNIAKTPIKIRHELRSILQEFLFMRVKPVYKNEFEYVPHILTRSQSCPDLTFYKNFDSPSMQRKRAFSECSPIITLQRVQSETDLNRIDKERTFSQQHNFSEQQELIRKVVDALGTLDKTTTTYQGYDGFTDEEILMSERYPSSKRQSFSIQIPKRRRAVSEVKAPHPCPLKTDYEHTWYGQHAIKQLADFRSRIRMNSEATSETATTKSQTSWLVRIKNRFLMSKDENLIDIEKQTPSPTFDEQQYLSQTSQGRYSLLSMQLQQDSVLEHTSIADFIRALSSITTTPETVLSSNNLPKRKLGIASISPPNLPSSPKVRRIGILPTSRRSSLMPDIRPSAVLHEQRRRFSLRPVEENLLGGVNIPPPPPTTTQLPPYTPPLDDNTQQLSRRYSRVANPTQTSINSPVQRQLNRKDRDDGGSSSCGNY